MPAMQQMERPPMPPDMAAQQGPPGGGAKPFGGMGDMLAEKAGAGNPMKAAIDMTEKIWSNAVKANPKLGAYVARAMAILKSGLEEAAGDKPEAAQNPENGGMVPKGPGAGDVPA